MSEQARVGHISVPLRWRDLDYQGHVYHGVMLTLLDEGRARFFGDCLGFNAPDSYVVVRVVLDYHSETLLQNGPLDIGFEVQRLGNTSLTTREVVRDRNDRHVASAETTCVLWDHASGAPRPITAEERSCAETFSASLPEGAEARGSAEIAG